MARFISTSNLLLMGSLFLGLMGASFLIDGVGALHDLGLTTAYAAMCSGFTVIIGNGIVEFFDKVKEKHLKIDQKVQQIIQQKKQLELENTPKKIPINYKKHGLVEHHLHQILRNLPKSISVILWDKNQGIITFEVLHKNFDNALDCIQRRIITQQALLENKNSMYVREKNRKVYHGAPPSQSFTRLRQSMLDPGVENKTEKPRKVTNSFISNFVAKFNIGTFSPSVQEELITPIYSDKFGFKTHHLVCPLYFTEQGQAKGKPTVFLYSSKIKGGTSIIQEAVDQFIESHSNIKGTCAVGKKDQIGVKIVNTPDSNGEDWYKTIIRLKFRGKGKGSKRVCVKGKEKITVDGENWYMFGFYKMANK